MVEAGVRDVARAVDAATSVASGLGLSADEAIVLHASNRLAIRLLPSDVLARVASAAHQAAQLEVDLALRLAGTDTPVAALDPRVAPPANVLNTKKGPLFIDLETCCRGPVEFDLAHVPNEVSERYPNVDDLLLSQCRVLALAMVAAWRLDPGDQFPSGSQAARELLRALRVGPPYPPLSAITGLE